MRRQGDVRIKRIGESEEDYQYALEYWYESGRGYGWRPLNTYTTFAEALSASDRAQFVWRKEDEARRRLGSR